jgi:hypothetical protein
MQQQLKPSFQTQEVQQQGCIWRLGLIWSHGPSDLLPPTFKFTGIYTYLTNSHTVTRIQK